MNTPQTWPRWALLLVAGLSVLAVAWSAGQLVTSTLAEYDDEGYVMISLASYLEGRPLYAQTYTQYGPAYYQLVGTTHRLTGLPVNHDVTRFRTLLVWLTAAALSAGIVYRLTSQPAWSWVAFLAAACHLDKLSLEPGHPQEVCLLGILVTLLASTWIDSPSARTSRWAAVVMGLSIASVVMTKINVGGLLAIAVAASLLVHAPRGSAVAGRIAHGCTAAVVSLMLIVPAVVCRQCWFQRYTLALPLLVTVATAAVCWWSHERRSDSSPWPVLNIVVAVSVSASVASAAWCLHEGTSVRELMYGLVGQHLGFDASFYHSAPIFWPAVLLGSGLVAVLRPASRSPGQFVPPAASVALFVLAGLTGGYFLSTGQRMESGLQLRGLSTWLLSFGPLVAWAVVPWQPSSLSRPSTLLALVACLMPLMAYPTPGTQVELGTLPLLIVVVTLVARRWPAYSNAEQGSGDRAFASWRQPVVGLAMLLLVIVVDRDIRWTARRQAGIPLALPGATWLRLPEHQARQQQALVSALQDAQVDTFVFAEHGQNRFYFWTDRQPPTGYNATFWPYMLTANQQQAVIERLAAEPRTCVVALRNGQGLVPPHRPVPLRKFLVDHYRPVRQVGGWEIWQPVAESTGTRPVTTPVTVPGRPSLDGPGAIGSAADPAGDQPPGETDPS